METLIDDRKIKDLFKQAIIEAIEEKKEVVHDLLVEVMEDIAMVRAIHDGEDSGPASRDDIFQILEGKKDLHENGFQKKLCQRSTKMKK